MEVRPVMKVSCFLAYHNHCSKCVTNVKITFYTSASPLNSAGSIMFWGCVSICKYIRTIVHASCMFVRLCVRPGRRIPMGLPSHSSLLYSVCLLPSFCQCTSCGYIFRL